MNITVANYSALIDGLLSSPGTSFWLKDTLRSGLCRDPVDACHDAEILAALLRARCDDALGLSKMNDGRENI